MKKLLFISSLFFTVLSFAQTQSEMNKAASEAYKKADEELNTAYKKLIKEYKSDITFVKSLRKAQRLWVSFRDAELEMKFPGDGNKQFIYGSVYPMCVAQFLEVMTKKRIKQLKIWLDGVEEGDMCSGSIKVY